MLVIGIRYLLGVATATHPTDRTRSEWPPHPGRLFMALVAAHFDSRGDDVECEALRWLEQQGAPSLAASGAEQRDPVTHFVPANDASIPKVGKSGPSAEMIVKGVQLLPFARQRYPRQFPTIVPASDIVYMIWQSEPEPRLKNALSELCRKVTYLGHSSSLVQVWLQDDAVDANLVPIAEGTALHRLRVPGPGTLTMLEARYKAGLRPAGLKWIGYGRAPAVPSPQAPGTVFSPELLILRKVEGDPINLLTTDRIYNALRDTLMSLCPIQPPPEWLSGHPPIGGRSLKDHISIFPLADVGHQYADGHVLGLAIAVPRTVDADEQSSCWTGVLYDKWGMTEPIELRMGSLGLWKLELEERPDLERPISLRKETWTGAQPATRWSTVTPIALDRHPKGKDRYQKMEADIYAACERVGLPRPESVAVHGVSLFKGAPLSADFPTLRRKSDNGPISHTHATMAFSEPVVGPVIVGAGRYRGYGLCRPLPERGS